MSTTLSTFGSPSMTAPIRRLLLKHARDAFVSQAKIDRAGRHNRDNEWKGEIATETDNMTSD